MWRFFVYNLQLRLASPRVVDMSDHRTLLRENAEQRANGAYVAKYEPPTFQAFEFSYSFWSHDKFRNVYVSQDVLYSVIGTDIVDSIFDGRNVCTFAYGQVWLRCARSSSRLMMKFLLRSLQLTRKSSPFLTSRRRSDGIRQDVHHVWVARRSGFDPTGVGRGASALRGGDARAPKQRVVA